MEWSSYKANHERVQRIRDLVDEGALGAELCPEPDYWHWPILKPYLLPDEFTQDSNTALYGEIRHYW